MTGSASQSICRGDRAGELHPVGVPVSALPCIPGFRCAPPCAMESGPFGASGARRSRSPERASFHSPGCNPGCSTHLARPLPACPAGAQVWRANYEAVNYAAPCRLARQERKFGGLKRPNSYSPPNFFTCQTSWQGSKMSALGALLARQTPSPARQAGRGLRRPGTCVEQRGCNPGDRVHPVIVALKGRHFPRASFEAHRGSCAMARVFTAVAHGPQARICHADW